MKLEDRFMGVSELHTKIKSSVQDAGCPEVSGSWLSHFLVSWGCVDMSLKPSPTKRLLRLTTQSLTLGVSPLQAWGCIVVGWWWLARELVNFGMFYVCIGIPTGGCQ